jgi:hypothetical protein
LELLLKFFLLLFFLDAPAELVCCGAAIQFVEHGV